MSDFKKCTYEEELFFLLTDYKKPNRDRILELLALDLDWSFLLGHLMFNRLGGIAYYTICNIRPEKIDDINSEFRLSLYLNYEGQKLRQKSLKKYTLELADRLNSSNIKYAFLKGAILSNVLYPIGTRVSNDIDLLVPKANLKELSCLLREMGFVQGRYEVKNDEVIPATRKDIINHRINFGELMPFVKKVNEPGLNFVEVDVNFSLDWVPDNDGKVEAFLNNVTECKVNNTILKTIDRELFFLHLCVHFYKEASVYYWVRKTKDLNYYKLLDIYTIVFNEKYNLNWDRFWRYAVKFKLEKACYFTLLYAYILVPRLGEYEKLVEIISNMDYDKEELLDLVYDASDPNVVYKWKEGLKDRFFDMDRY